LWYPSNKEALVYNQSLRAVMDETEGARAGFVSEGELLVSNKMRQMIPLSSPHDKSAEKSATPDSIERNLAYTQPRTVTLNTKYQGVPTINVWTGYAVMIVSKTGARRVEKGPSTILLDYDEGLDVLEMSSGKPK